MSAFLTILDKKTKKVLVVKLLRLNAMRALGRRDKSHEFRVHRIVIPIFRAKVSTCMGKSKRVIYGEMLYSS